MKVTQAYRYTLDPTAPQERALRPHPGAARCTWNCGPAKREERYDADGKWYPATDLRKLRNAEKKAARALAWRAENSKCGAAGRAAVNEEPGTRQRGKTGTAAWRQAAAATGDHPH